MKVTTLFAGVVLLAPTAGAQRKVDAHHVFSDSLPQATITLDAALTNLGTQRFVLYNVASAEQHFFAELDGTRIKRFVWIQFEGYLTGANGRYDYHADSLMQLWGRQVYMSAGLLATPTVERRPDSDGAKMRQFVREHGLTFDSTMLYHRLVTLVDDGSRNELMIIYMEAPSAYGRPGVPIKSLLDESLERAKRSITLERR